MNARKISMIILCAVQMLTLPNTAIAAPPPSQSGASITFEENTAIIDPVDPLNPANPLDPPDTGTGMAGPLSINYISPFEFGVVNIPTTTTTYSGTRKNAFVQVSDFRGTGAGWKLTASASEFKDPGSQPSLEGAYITLNNTALTSISDSDAPSAENTITLTTDNATVPIMNAGTNEGMGTWVAHWVEDTPNTKVTLTIPPYYVRAVTYTCNITWTLNVAP